MSRAAEYAFLTLSRSSSSRSARSTYGLTVPAASVTFSFVLAIIGGSFRLLARAFVPLALLFILAACGGSARSQQVATHVVRGDGFSFSAPRRWSVARTDKGVVARRSTALVSATRFTLLKAYDPATFDRVVVELDRTASKLAAEAGGTVTQKATTT